MRRRILTSRPDCTSIKFGVPLSKARELYRLGAEGKYLRAAGVSVHIGSQITEMSPFRESMEKIAELVVALRADGHEIRYVEAGGGLGISYRSEEESDFGSEVKSYSAQVVAPLAWAGNSSSAGAWTVYRRTCWNTGHARCL